MNEIDGMYSFVVYDRSKSSIILARDRVGEKPLYYGLDGDRLFFSSQLKSIKKIPNIDFKINKKALNYFFNYCYIPAPLSIYENIYKLEPGKILILQYDLKEKIKLKERELFTYWYPRKDCFTFTKDNLKTEDIENLLQSSVEKQLISDVEVGCFLSGGIDSSLVSVLASRVMKKRLNTFTISFNDKSYDESIYAKQVADKIDSKHHEIKISNENIFSTIKEVTHCYDEPFADASQIPTMILSNVTSKYVKVALSGDGGDELFCGYNRYFWGDHIWSKIDWINPKLRLIISNNLDKIPLNFWKYFYNFIQNISFGNFSIPNPEIKTKKLIHRMANVDNFDQLFLSLIKISKSNSVLNEDFIEDTNFDELYFKNEYLIDKSSKKKYMTFDFLTYLPDDILTKVDRASMFYSLETRCPFLSRDVIEASMSLPNEKLYKNNSGKKILKEVLSKTFDTKFLERPKTGFGIPIGQYIKNDLNDWSRKYLSKEICDKFGVLNFDKLNNLYKMHMNGYDQTEILWQSIIFNSWAENNL